MNYIQPNGSIYLCHVDNYSSDLSDAPLFKTMEEQFNWFTSKRVMLLENQSYTRRSSNTLRIEATINQVYNVNYLMFRNTGFENHWFYAFVTNIEYVNNTTCNVFFSIDPIQTWFTLDQASLGECYVLREHVSDDSIGVNLEPEPIDTGEMMAEPNSYNHLSEDYCEPCIILATSEPSNSHESGGGRINNTYSGCYLTAWDFNNIDGLNGYIKAYSNAGKPDAVVGLWMAPKGAVGGNNWAGQQIWQGNQNHSIEARGDELTASTGFKYWDNKMHDIREFVPKNNKLYTYPYTFYRVMTGQGNYADYRYEFFQQAKNLHAPMFRIMGNVLQPITVTCSPINYKGRICSNYVMPDGRMITENMPYWTESLSVSGYPQCSWSNDSYVAWMAQNSVPMANMRHALEATNANNRNTVYAQNQNRMSVTSEDIATDWVGGIVGAIGSLIGGNVAGAASQIGGTLINSVDKYTQTYYGNKNAELSVQNAINNSEINLVTSQQNAAYQASMLANTQGGTINSGSNTIGDSSPNFGSALSFYGFRMMPNIYRLQKIDKYFDMFGYAVNTVKVPNIRNRPHWNYVKTVNADVRGDMPATDKQNIKDLLDRGIRFWKTPDDMGNYELDNK